MSTENGNPEEPKVEDQNTENESGTDSNSGTDLTAELEKWKALARKHEERAKANHKASQELEELRKAQMSEAERAIEEAKIAGRQEAFAQMGAQLVDAEIRAQAAGRLSPEQLNSLFQGLNRAAFLKEDGTVDTESVTNFVNGIAPVSSNESRFSDVGQGARGNMNMPLNGDPLLRDLKNKLGIK